MNMPSRHDHAGHSHHRPPEAPEADALKDPVAA